MVLAKSQKVEDELGRIDIAALVRVDGVEDRIDTIQIHGARSPARRDERARSAGMLVLYYPMSNYHDGRHCVLCVHDAKNIALSVKWGLVLCEACFVLAVLIKNVK